MLAPETRAAGRPPRRPCARWCSADRAAEIGAAARGDARQDVAPRPVASDDHPGRLRSASLGARRASARHARRSLRTRRRADARTSPSGLDRGSTRAAGDAGRRASATDRRVPKLDCRIAAFGAVDELNSHIGARARRRPARRAPRRCSPASRTSSSTSAPTSRPVRRHRPAADHDAQISALEHDCDRFNAALPRADELRPRPAAPRSRRGCTSRGPSAAAQSARRSRPPSRWRSTRSRSST